MKRFFPKNAFYVPIGVLFLGLAAFIPTAIRAHDDFGSHHEENFTVYATLDLTNMRVNSADPLLPPGSRGDSLVVDGNLYRHGDGMYGATAGNDPNETGAIGKIRCRATIITDPSDTSAHFASFVSELYSLPDDLTNILADGLGPNLGFTARRIITGGTGRFHNMIGEIEETEIGFNKTNGCNLRVTFKLTRVGDDRR